MINPWTFGLGGVLIALAVGFGVGLRLGEAHLEAFQAQVSAAAAQQDARVAQQALAQRELKEKTDAKHQVDRRALRAAYDTDLERVRREARRRAGLLPPVPASPAGGAGSRSACFDREELARRLDAALERFRDGAAAILFRGDAARGDLATCARWAVEAERLGKIPPP